MDVISLRKAHDDFLAVAAEGGFGPPPAGEWDADQILAHVALGEMSGAAAALAIAAGQRAVYDNRPSLDEWNLRRAVREASGRRGSPAGACGAATRPATMSTGGQAWHTTARARYRGP